MGNWRRRIALAAVLATGGVACGEWPTLRAKPQPLPGIPPYPYQPTATTQPKPTATATATGLPRLTLGTEGDQQALPAGLLPTTTATRETTTTRATAGRCRIDHTTTTTRETTTTTTPVLSPSTSAATFTLLDQVIRVDHCTVSKVSVTLYPDGKYVLAFRADQNPPAADPLTPALKARGTGIDTGLDPAQFRRNKFYLTVRGYAADPLGERGTRGTKAAVLDLPVEPFWVNRGEAYHGLVEGTSEAVRRNYKLVERVDVDFTYR